MFLINQTIMKKILRSNLAAALFVLYLVVPSLSSAQVNLEEGLVIYYPFNGNAIDASGNSYDGIINGATLSEDRFNEPDNAFYFNSMEYDYILVENQIPDLTVLSISVWIYLVNPDGNATIFCDATTDLGNDFLLNVTAESIGIRADKGDAVLNYEDGAVFDLNLLNAWHHIVWLMSITSSSIYLDGIVIFTTNEYGSCVNYHTTQASLGRRHVWEEGDQYFDGKIDEFRLYNRLLNEEEIQTLHDKNSGLFELENDQNMLSIYPNPTSTQITISTPTTPNKNTFLTIFKINGQQLLTRQITEQQTVIDVGALPQGVYIVKVTDDSTMKVGKFIQDR
jgi:hypothetical protein